ncbi:Wadjet anti-phage system protein JetD domain-containing protein [Clostridium cibarium]|uniref:Wadjet protein JetD C-terminal domain-containing protein n=1 Tax=Clostridium cibarium TaxID=2762247 RepID=A0ABR8PWF1_9CLOT|nr:Wadjet anti-phage system protein JetD domain-containing protein [Clostridium cibarium]MBD7912480.1 hypothetical protein [Clostridium cibarium]
MKLTDKFKKKKITLDEIKDTYNIKEYLELYKLINRLIEENEIEPIEASGGNGKKPALYSRYKLIEKEKDNSEFIDELNFKIYSKLDISYYKSNLDKYKENRKYILQLSDFLKNKVQLLNRAVSMNERSFQIWGREKFIQKEKGKTILKNLKVDLKLLNYYDTSEPLAYYSKSKKQPQNILILENKDTFYTMRKYLINTKNSIFDIDISTVIYGGGKNIRKTFKDYKISVENYLSNRDNVLYYFGDLDYEGILIYEGLLFCYKDKYDIRLFNVGYEKMINKAIDEKYDLPKTKEGQNRNLKGEFIKEFSEKYKVKIEEILKNNLYIPQEILNICDLMEEE